MNALISLIFRHAKERVGERECGKHGYDDAIYKLMICNTSDKTKQPERQTMTRLCQSYVSDYDCMFLIIYRRYNASICEIRMLDVIVLQ